MKINEDEEFERAPRVEAPGKIYLFRRSLFAISLERNIREIRVLFQKKIAISSSSLFILWPLILPI